MHVNIVQLTDKNDDWKNNHLDEAEIFAMNQEAFGDGVEEYHGADVSRVVDEMCDALKCAITCRGAEEVHGKRVLWVEIEPARIGDLFLEHRARFCDALEELGDTDGFDFADGSSKIESAMQRLNESYNFDWMYVVDRYGSAKTVSAWLRALRQEAKEKPGVRRFYVHAAYDGDQ